jgi:hypothetical protein
MWSGPELRLDPPARERRQALAAGACVDAGAEARSRRGGGRPTFVPPQGQRKATGQEQSISRLAPARYAIGGNNIFLRAPWSGFSISTRQRIWRVRASTNFMPVESGLAWRGPCLCCRPRLGDRTDDERRRFELHRTVRAPFPIRRMHASKHS